MNKGWALLGLSIVLGLVLIYGLLFSGRHMQLADRPVVVHMADIHIPAEMPHLMESITDEGVHVPKAQNWVGFALGQGLMGAPLDTVSGGKMGQPAVGYSVREISFFGMPFGFYTELGDVIYVSNQFETVYGTPLPEVIATLDKANGREVMKGGFFPFWNFLWGWLWVAGLAAGIWIYMKILADKRTEMGLI